MRVLFVIEMPFEPSNGGVQQSTYKLAKMFERSSHQVKILSFSGTKGVSEMKYDLEVFYAGEKVNSNTELTSFFDKYDPDVCINQMGYHTDITKLVRSLGGQQMSLINTIRINPLNFIDNVDSFIASYFKKKGISFIPVSLVKSIIKKYHVLKQSKDYKLLLHYVNSLVFLSPSFINELKYFNVDVESHKEKLKAIPNPFPISSEQHDVKKEKIILFVGRLNVLQKRVDLLMEIWRELHPKLKDWRFWVVGDGPERNWMEEYCEQHNLRRVTFFGYDDPTKYYKKASIFHFTSAFEGFGNVLVEAQRDGVVPILFDSYSAAKDIVIHGNSGYLIEPFDINEYIDHTIEIANNTQKLKMLSVNAIKNSEKFSEENVMSKWRVILNLNNFKIK